MFFSQAMQENTRAREIVKQAPFLVPFTSRVKIFAVSYHLIALICYLFIIFLCFISFLLVVGFPISRRDGGIKPSADCCIT